MKLKTTSITLTGIVVAGLCMNSAVGQLLVGNDDATAPVAANAWNVNPNTGSSTVLWGDANPDVWGMTYDPTTGTVYASGGSDLHGGPVGGGNPPLLGSITNPDGSTLVVVGLAWANGKIYASRNIANEAIYEVDPGTLLATVKLDYDDASYDFGGIAFNPADGLLYGTNDDTSPFGSGLYSIDLFGSGAINLVAPYPAGETDIDGLAVGNNIAYLVEDEPGNTIHPYDLVNGVYLPDIASPMTSSEIFSGAAWVPEPSGLVLLLVGVLPLLRRRK
jgi:hypothetical protein